jgi:ubiquinone/menaquinone biosynthesis C-methylase UbiE
MSNTTMSIGSWIKRIINPATGPGGQKDTDPATAYDLWAAAYDNQPGNLMLDLDEGVFSGLLDTISIPGKTIVDVGCGTGRHWRKILAGLPQRLIGYDVSPGMLAKLRDKIPGAETHLLQKEKMPEMPDHSCDAIVSTLTVAHIPFIETALKEWHRILRNNADIIITDYHPEALAKGGKRTFRHEGKTVAVKNHVHAIGRLRAIAWQLGWKEIQFTERVIDDSVKGYYERQNALHLFEDFKDIPIIYGMHLKRV